MSIDYDKQSELEAIRAIYPDLIDDSSSADHVVVVWKKGRLYVHIRDGSSSCLPKFEIIAPSLSPHFKKRLAKKLVSVCEDNWDVPRLYSLVEAISNFCECESVKEKSDNEFDSGDDSFSVVDSSPSCSVDSFNRAPVCRINIYNGRVFEDRKSIFQAHVAIVSSKEEALRALSQLKENSKIARATHNMYAFRVRSELPNGRVVEQQDCDCDGETGAGPKLLKLLHLMKAMNIIVIVTRWYGGIHLGPDRFRHISNLAREVVLYGQKSLTQ